MAPLPPCPATENVSLAGIGYYGIGGLARWLASPRSVGEIGALLGWCRSEGFPVIVTGRGSNMLFSDEPFDGVVVSTAAMNRMFWLSPTELFCEAGVDNTDLSLALLAASKTGGEWLYRLPGMVGSTVRMNGRCYGREISEVTRGIVAMGLDGTLRWLDPHEVFRGYKETSLMGNREIVAGVVLGFPESADQSAIRAAMDGYGADRDAKHQFDYPSCGSTFKNSRAAGRPSGKIFEELGFRGRRIGGAMVSEHHANFIFNTGNARADEVLQLAASMRRAAREVAHVELELELQCAGLFDQGLLDACGIPCVPHPEKPGMAWAGLMDHVINAPDAFPRMLLSGPLLDYGCGPSGFPSGSMVAVQQLASLTDAARNPSAPFIRWETFVGQGHPFRSLPDEPDGSFVDRLWAFDVAELFIGWPDGYLEFEMTPKGHWVALGFSAPRQRAPGHAVPDARLWSGVLRRLSGDGRFGMEFSYTQLASCIRRDILPLQCCASLALGMHGLFPWWNDAGAPDFHQPSRFFMARLA